MDTCRSGACLFPSSGDRSAACAAFNWIGRGDSQDGGRRARSTPCELRWRCRYRRRRGHRRSDQRRGASAPARRTPRAAGAAFKADIAVDPVEGTSYLVRGQTNALAVLAVAPRGAMLNPGPAFYMEKFVASAPARGKIDPALAGGEEAHRARRGPRQGRLELTVFVLEKPRHRELVDRVLASGARVALYPAGDVAGALMAAIPGSGIDALMGTGGTPEGVMSACAIRAIGGEFLARLDPQLQTEAKAVKEAGHRHRQMV